MMGRKAEIQKKSKIFKESQKNANNFLEIKIKFCREDIDSFRLLS